MVASISFRRQIIEFSIKRGFKSEWWCDGRLWCESVDILVLRWQILAAKVRSRNRREWKRIPPFRPHSVLDRVSTLHQPSLLMVNSIWSTF